VTAAPPGSDSIGRPSGDTPFSWRLGAAGLLAAGFGVGVRLARVGPGPSLAIAAGLTTAALRLALAGRHPPVVPGASGASSEGTSAIGSERASRGVPSFSVVVAARDEAAVLPRLVGDIAAQDWRAADGSPRFELIVVDDRSTDGTGPVVMAAAAEHGIAAVTRVIRRDGPDLPDGKGAALTAAPPEACRCDVVVVLDGDARVGPGFLRSLAGYVMAGVPALTARRRVLGADMAAFAAMQADEQTLDGEIQRGRWSLGGCSEFRGNGIVIDRALLASLGGWRATALTEDLDLSSRLAAACGTSVAWAIEAEVWEEPVTSWAGLWRQRCRWAEGAIRRAFEHGPAVLRSQRLSGPAKVDFAVYAGQLVAPAVILGTLVATARSGPAAAGILLAGYAASAGGLAWDALRWETDAAGGPLRSSERAWRATRAAAFSGFWLAAVPAALWRLATRRGRVRYDKMPHGRPLG
jgi:hypothetical protein